MPAAKSDFKKLFLQLSKIAGQFDADSLSLQYKILKLLTSSQLPFNKQLIAYGDLLLFLASHPQNATQANLVKKEFLRISNFLKDKKRAEKDLFVESGLPYTNIVTRFSHDCVSWLLQNKKYQTTFDSFADDGKDLNDILKLTLTSIEKERTSSGLSTDDLLEALSVEPHKQLSFIVHEFQQFNHQPYLKDYLFDSLELYIKVNSKQKTFSKFYNTLPGLKTFYHNDLLKKFDSAALLNTSLPRARALNEKEQKLIINCIKEAFVLTARETDPATFLQNASLKLFDLERGISVAIYGMTAERQLPIESYVGYTLFKNGFPAAYGGSWVFGNRALFGMNIFEPFRGGESGYMMCQLLRTYRQVFNINYFEIEPYQFGKDNPDGIASGAYWFYHRYGFRSVDKKEHLLSEKEFQKIKNVKGYRSSKQTLEQLAESYLALDMGSHTALTVSKISIKVSAYIKKHFNNNRHKAETDVLNQFLLHAKKDKHLLLQNRQALIEMAFMATVLKIRTEKQFELLEELVLTKYHNLYLYQVLLREFIQSLN